jgi:hypothetical protein
MKSVFIPHNMIDIIFDKIDEFVSNKKRSNTLNSNEISFKDESSLLLISNFENQFLQVTKSNKWKKNRLFFILGLIILFNLVMMLVIKFLL